MARRDHTNAIVIGCLLLFINSQTALAQSGDDWILNENYPNIYENWLQAGDPGDLEYLNFTTDTPSIASLTTNIGLSQDPNVPLADGQIIWGNPLCWDSVLLHYNYFYRIYDALGNVISVVPDPGAVNDVFNFPYLLESSGPTEASVEVPIHLETTVAGFTVSQTINIHATAKFNVHLGALGDGSASRTLLTQDAVVESLWLEDSGTVLNVENDLTVKTNLSMMHAATSLNIDTGTSATCAY